MKSEFGFLFILGFDGKAIPDWLMRFADRFGLGGVVLYERNFSDNDELKRLIADIKGRLGAIFVAVDQEGGEKRRVPNIEPYYDPFEMGRRFSDAEIYEIFRRSAMGLAELGFNLNFAPCCDVAVDGAYIGKRSFGSEPARVADAVYSAVSGIRSGGLFATAKHFPGLGRTTIDPHNALPILDASIDELASFEFIPFYAALKADVDFVMTTHIVIPALDERPATFSDAVINILRNELKFDGIVITDDILMGALSSVDIAERIERSFRAGHDMVLISSAERWLIDLVENMVIPDFDDKIGRVKKAKRR